MRQVGRDELIYLIAQGMRGITPTTWKLAIDPRRDQHDRARALIACRIADALARHEILSDGSEPQPGMFSRPVARMLSEDVPTGAPMLE